MARIARSLTTQVSSVWNLQPSVMQLFCVSWIITTSSIVVDDAPQTATYRTCERQCNEIININMPGLDSRCSRLTRIDNDLHHLKKNTALIADWAKFRKNTYSGRQRVAARWRASTRFDVHWRTDNAARLMCRWVCKWLLMYINSKNLYQKFTVVIEYDT